MLLYTLILSCIWLSTVCLKQVILWLGLLIFFISDTLDLRFEIIGIDSDNFESMAVIHCYSCEC